MFKTPEMRKSYSHGESDEPPPKRGRSTEDFLMFCKMILDYENYDETREDYLRRRHTSSPLGSTGSGGESSLSAISSEDQDSLRSPGNIVISDEDSDDDDQITCYCKKPYAGRPMIECSSCATWVHLACAKVKRTAIPDVWNCPMCKTKSTKGGAKSRARKARSRKLASSGAATGDLFRPLGSKKKSF
eukprot:GFUD01009548.1.p1 GENE.GFUD01009548.1~~GFUD01009548.1.p1  ORF type:complete len:188 (-),score=29.54 GFUD01009548.1:1468-2031(-)